MDNNTNTQQNPLLSEEEGIDIKKYIFLILGHWWWFGISIFLSLTIAYLINRYAQQIYSTNCSVIVGEEKPGTGSIDNVIDELSRVRNNRRKAVVENEITILKSYKLARTVLEELDFGVSYVAVGRRGIAESHRYKNCPFIVEFDTTKNNLIGYPIFVTMLSEEEYRLGIDDSHDINQVMRFGEKFQSESFNFTVKLRDPANYKLVDGPPRKFYFYLNDINNLTKHYRSALTVEVNDEKGAILTLSIQGFVPSQLSDYLNKLSEVYLRSNLNEKNRISENTIQFIDEQLNGIVDSLENTGLKLQQFRSNNKVIDLSKESSFIYDQLQILQSEKAMLEMQANYYKYLLDYIISKNDSSYVIAPSVVGIEDNLLDRLVSTLNEQLTQLRQLSFSMSSNSPQLILIEKQIMDARKNLQENLESLVESNKIAQEGLKKRITKIDVEVQKLPGTEKQMIDIERKFKINDQIYTFLLQKRAEAGITKASNASDHKLLDIARAENAVVVRPKITMNYMLGFSAGIGIPLMLLLLLEFFNNKITDRRFLETYLKAPVIGNLGHNMGDTEIPVHEKPNSSLSESFRALRTNIQYILKQQQGGVIAVTSAVSGEGKTFCSVNLAGIIAMSGKKTLLVNLDLRRPKIHRFFGLDNAVGISTYLIGKSDLKDIIFDTHIQNLSVATSGPIPPNPAELIGSDKMSHFIKQVRGQFDYIIVDTPPLAVVTDTLIMKDLLDAIVFIIRHNYSNKQVVELVNNIYSKNLISGLGVAVNDIQLQGYYGYSYRYGYGYGYGYSYNYHASYYDEDVKEKRFIHKFIKRFNLWKN